MYTSWNYHAIHLMLYCELIVSTKYSPCRNCAAVKPVLKCSFDLYFCYISLYGQYCALTILSINLSIYRLIYLSVYLWFTNLQKSPRAIKQFWQSVDADVVRSVSDTLRVSAVYRSWNTTGAHAECLLDFSSNAFIIWLAYVWVVPRRWFIAVH